MWVFLHFHLPISLLNIRAGFEPREEWTPEFGPELLDLPVQGQKISSLIALNDVTYSLGELKLP